MELPKMYFESLSDNAMKGLVHHCKPKIVNRGKQIKFMKRSWFHMIARLTYKLLRAVYVSIIFYFVPFVVLFLNFLAVKGGGEN